MSFYVLATGTNETLTEMFCKAVTQSYSSIIDLLENDLPTTWKKKWTNVNPSFSSTMRKHLVLRQEPENHNEKDSKWLF